jgi:hypothetical protein
MNQGYQEPQYLHFYRRSSRLGRFWHFPSTVRWFISQYSIFYLGNERQGQTCPHLCRDTVLYITRNVPRQGLHVFSWYLVTRVRLVRNVRAEIPFSWLYHTCIDSKYLCRYIREPRPVSLESWFTVASYLWRMPLSDNIASNCSSSWRKCYL